MNKWDVRFMRLAKEISTWSRDPSSQIGSVIINSDKRIIATGYNGFPRGIEDTYDRLNNRELKYPLIVHAEANSLLNALYNGISVRDCSLYVYGLPVCPDCAKLVIQSGITSVYFCVSKYDQKWTDLWNNKSKPMFDEVGIKTHIMLKEVLEINT